ncbi:deleted in malignant brain tumors 1 protein, partial [Biomphalaria glabrata]
LRDVSLECNVDFVTIYDGPDSTSCVISRFCSLPEVDLPAIRSTTNELFIAFTSDEAVTFKGFLLQYTTTDEDILDSDFIYEEDYYYPTYFPGKLLSFMELFRSYCNNLKHSWVIETEPGSRIQL